MLYVLHRMVYSFFFYSICNSTLKSGRHYHCVMYTILCKNPPPPIPYTFFFLVLSSNFMENYYVLAQCSDKPVWKLWWLCEWRWRQAPYSTSCSTIHLGLIHKVHYEIWCYYYIFYILARYAIYELHVWYTRCGVCIHYILHAVIYDS